MSAYLAGYAAGILSTLSPCVLPLIPVLLGAALQTHRFGPLALAAGLAASFAGLGIVLSAFGFALGLDQDAIRLTAAAIMAGFGLVLLVPALGRAFAAAAAPLAGGGNALLARVSGDGLAGQFGLGILLGAVWAPCTGPTLGAAVGLASSGDDLAHAAAVMIVFALGAASPVVALAYGLSSRRKMLGEWAARAKPVMGGILAAIGMLVLTGADKSLEAVLVRSMPDWLVNLTVMF